MGIDYKAELTRLYSLEGKHSSYQVLPESILSVIGEVPLQVSSRCEHERFDYIQRKIGFQDCSILDIGGNTGYFTFASIECGAQSVEYFEGNENHAHFVDIASRATGLQRKIHVNPRYFLFDIEKEVLKADCCFCLNVVHHLGDDYGDSALSRESAKSLMLHEINSLAGHVETLVFQMGYNWQGDRNKPLFACGTKTEVVEFVESETKGFFDIEHVGIAETQRSGVKYFDLSGGNASRDDSIGEFLNRPLFIMRSKLFNSRELSP